MKPLFLYLLAATAAQATVKLPAIFSDHAVLQRQTSVPVWGWGEKGEEVTVSIAGQSVKAKADEAGKWMVKLANLEAGGPHTLTVSGSSTLVVNDVLVGEVWLGSGQSNMAMQVSRAKDLEKEKAAATTPLIRHFTEASGGAEQPMSEGKGSWVVCSPETVANFSATAYFFGREIHNALKVPVGLINSSVGGTPIESWIAADKQRAQPELQGFFAAAKPAPPFDAVAAKAKYDADYASWKEAAKVARAAKMPAPRPPQDPIALRAKKGNVGGLFNGKIAPLIPYAIRGALWYQGEANTSGDKPPYYEHQLALLISDWRAKWGYEFPFAWAQLPNFNRPGEGWPVVREAMQKTLRLPNTGMGINIDIGEAGNIHPQNKQEVGRRLSLWALGTVYGQQVEETSGPLFAKQEVRGQEIALSFTHAQGLKAKDGGALKHFVIAGADKQWKPAQARIDGSTVIVTSAEVAAPTAVRYCWLDNPEATLFNHAGLPAAPFRTDDWAIDFTSAAVPARPARPAAARRSAAPLGRGNAAQSDEGAHGSRSTDLEML
jgi:sialate O-acetylesterase